MTAKNSLIKFDDDNVDREVALTFSNCSHVIPLLNKILKEHTYNKTTQLWKKTKSKEKPVTIFKQGVV